MSEHSCSCCGVIGAAGCLMCNSSMRLRCKHWMNRARRQSGLPTFISCQRQDANVPPKRRQLHQGDKLCDVSTVPLVARWPVFWPADLTRTANPITLTYICNDQTWPAPCDTTNVVAFKDTLATLPPPPIDNNCRLGNEGHYVLDKWWLL